MVSISMQRENEGDPIRPSDVAKGNLGARAAAEEPDDGLSGGLFQIARKGTPAN